MVSSRIESPTNQLGIVYSMLGLQPNTQPWNVIFVSLDLEFKDSGFRNSCCLIKEVGFSILDTRSLFSARTSNPIPIRTSHFVVGGHQELLKKSKLFHFGTSEHLDIDDVDETIRNLFYIPDEMENVTGRKYRQIVLIGHALHSDLLIMRKRGIMDEDIDNIVARFDTLHLAKEVLGIGSGLDGLLSLLDCPHQDLHNGGNDANCTLRAFFLLVYYGLRPSVLDKSGVLKLEYLKALGMEPLPDNREKNALRKWKLEVEDVLEGLDVESGSFFERLWGSCS